MIERATDDTHGPFRKVVGVRDGGDSFYGAPTRQEILECGHKGKRLFREYQAPGKRRRCVSCRSGD